VTRIRFAGRALGPARCLADRLALLLLLPAAALACAPAFAQAFDPARPEIAEFIDAVADKHGFERAPLAALFAQVESKPSILQAIARPA
jgi:membrane-bound lytic murein transglycosylase B